MKCYACGRQVTKHPVVVAVGDPVEFLGMGTVTPTRTYGPSCARKAGLTPVRQMTVKMHKPSGVTLSTFRRALAANARQMSLHAEARPVNLPPVAVLDGQVPLWDDDTEGDTQ